MKFDYSVYLRKNCHIPLVLATFCFVCIIVAIFYFFKDKPHSAVKVLKLIALLSVAGFLLGINVACLSRGGFCLLFENEADQIQIEGIVEKTVEIDSLTGAKYDVDNNHGNGEALVINGEEYYMFSYGDTKVGDYVYMSVLPRSHFVMELRKTP